MRRRIAVVVVIAAAAGYLLRCEAQRRLERLRERWKPRIRHGRVLLRDMPHRYAEERFWPGSCWCGRKSRHPVHQGAGGAR